MSKFDVFQKELSKLREQVPRLVDLLQIGSDEIGRHWKNLDTKLLPLIDRHLPLMVAVCGGANAGKSMFFNSFLGINLSPVRGDAGSTRRVLVAGHPQIFDRKNLVTSLFEPFGSQPQVLTDPTELMQPGPPLYIVHEAVPREQVLMDTPDFDTGSNDRYINREIARQVLEACNVLIYIVTNSTYNNLENTRFMRAILTEAGMRRCLLVYSCSRTFSDHQVMDHLNTTAENLYGKSKDEYLIGYYRTDISDAVAAGREYMKLRPVRAGDPELDRLLQNLDPRQIREKQIQTTLAAFLQYVRQVLAASRITRDEIALYHGTLKLALSHAVQQALTTVPLEKIIQRMHQIWLDTSPGYLKFFRGMGSLIGKPARLIFGLAKGIAGGDVGKQTPGAGAADPLEELKANLIGAAAELRDKILAEEIIAETTDKDQHGAGLIEQLDRIRSQRRLQVKELPLRQVGSYTGSIILHVGAPSSARDCRRRLERKPWKATADAIVSTAENVLNISTDAELNRELADLVHEFRRQMNFMQKTRESFVASLNILPATLGIAYVLTTGDPVGGSGIYAKLHGLFGMHDLWALISIPASAGLDESSRKNLSDMLAPVVSRWFENRAMLVRRIFKDNVSGEVLDEVKNLIESADQMIIEIEKIVKRFEMEVSDDV